METKISSEKAGRSGYPAGNFCQALLIALSSLPVYSVAAQALTKDAVPLSVSDPWWDAVVSSVSKSEAILMKNIISDARIEIRWHLPSWDWL